MDTTLVVPRRVNRSRAGLRVGLRVAAVVAVVVLALLLRLRAVALLPADYDEDDYLRAGQIYAQHFAARNFAGIIDDRENYEHPPMTKLVFGAILLAEGPQSYSQPVAAGKNAVEAAPEVARQAQNLRRFNAIVGALTAGAVAAVNPLAGLLIGLNSWHIKYTSQAMLESLPAFFATLTLLLLLRSRQNGDRPFWLAAVALGLAAAGKYLYGAAALGAIVWFVWRARLINRPGAQRQRAQPREWAPIVLWGILALFTFYAADPALWPDPVGRLRESLQFGVDFATGEHVRRVGFGWAQPVVWLIGALPWHPGVMPLLLDGIFGFIALVVAWQVLRRRQRAAVPETRLLIALWFAFALVFLFLWPTKWPQYILTVTAPAALLAAGWLQEQWRNLRQWAVQRSKPGASWLSGFAPKRVERGALFWLLPALTLFLVLVAYPLLVQTAMATTDFQLRHLRDGVPGLLRGAGLGLLGLRPGEAGELFRFATSYDSVGRPVVAAAGTAASVPEYIGMGGVVYLFGWPDFLPILRFNVIWTVITIALATMLGLRLATLLQRPGLRGRRAWLALFVLPWAIPEFTGALIWNTLFEDAFGGINVLLGIQVKWLTDPQPVLNLAGATRPLAAALNGWGLAPIGQTLDFIAQGLTTTKAFWVLVLVGVWVAFPFMLLVTIAALRAIPADVYDAAQVDGAGGWALWRYITWPMIRPYVYAGAVLRGALLFNAFHIPLMLIGDTGRTGTTTLAEVGYLVLRYDSQYSVAAFINTTVLFVAIGLILLFNRQTRVGAGVEYV